MVAWCVPVAYLASPTAVVATADDVDADVLAAAEVADVVAADESVEPELEQPARRSVQAPATKARRVMGDDSMRSPTPPRRRQP